MCREALASDALQFTCANCQAAFDAKQHDADAARPPSAAGGLADTLEAAQHNHLEFLHLANQRTLCLVLQCHGPFGQLTQLGAIVHEGVRDVAELLAARQLAGNVMRAVAVERGDNELLVRVETLQLPPHVTLALEHLLERADEGFKLLKVCKKVSNTKCDQRTSFLNSMSHSGLGLWLFLTLFRSVTSSSKKH